jgi:hypothetical protein
MWRANRTISSKYKSSERPAMEFLLLQWTRTPRTWLLSLFVMREFLIWHYLKVCFPIWPWKIFLPSLTLGVNFFPYMTVSTFWALTVLAGNLEDAFAPGPQLHYVSKKKCSRGLSPALRRHLLSRVRCAKFQDHVVISIIWGSCLHICIPTRELMQL